MNKEIPCKDCITLAICKNKMEKFKSCTDPFQQRHKLTQVIINDLVQYCTLLHNYLFLEEIFTSKESLKYSQKLGKTVNYFYYIMEKQEKQ